MLCLVPAYTQIPATAVGQMEMPYLQPYLPVISPRAASTLTSSSTKPDWWSTTLCFSKGTCVHPSFLDIRELLLTTEHYLFAFETPILMVAISTCLTLSKRLKKNEGTFWAAEAALVDSRASLCVRKSNSAATQPLPVCRPGFWKWHLNPNPECVTTDELFCQQQRSMIQKNGSTTSDRSRNEYMYSLYILLQVKTSSLTNTGRRELRVMLSDLRWWSLRAPEVTDHPRPD